MKKVVCYGEVLWDVLPTGKKIGGAPLNVALRLQSLGMESYVISSIGNDANGQELLREIVPQNINIDFIQIDNNLGTSEVLVQLDEHGSASYEIKFPCAWDNIVANKANIDLVQSSDAFVFGSLVARNDKSRETLLELIDHAKYKIFDVNLRAPHYTEELLNTLMSKADFIKFNDDELVEICDNRGFKNTSLEECVKFIVKETGTSQICVTLGKDGALIFLNDQFFYNKGYKIIVADTVGSGDSFLASVITQLLNEENPQDAVDFACAVGAMVASKNGANPEITREEIECFMNERADT